MPKAQKKNDSAATVGYEAQLWQMADALRGSMDAAEYKHVVLGLIFLKYISDAFEEQHARLVAEQAQGADPEGPDDNFAGSETGRTPCAAKRGAPWMARNSTARRASSGCRSRRAGRT